LLRFSNIEHPTSTPLVKMQEDDENEEEEEEEEGDFNEGKSPLFVF
jgi:hypothetical protein